MKDDDEDDGNCCLTIVGKENWLEEERFLKARFARLIKHVLLVLLASLVSLASLDRNFEGSFLWCL